MHSTDVKMKSADVNNTEQILRTIQSNAEPFKICNKNRQKRT